MKTLNRRIIREFKAHFGRYLALFFMIVLGMYLVVSIAGMAETTIAGSDEYNKECNQQDGQFTTFMPLTDEQLSDLEQKYGDIEKVFSMDAEVDSIKKTVSGDNKDIVRVFKKRNRIDLVKLDEGSMPEADNEIVIMNLYADRNDIKVGDTIEFAGREFTVSGIGCIPDYNLTVKNPSDMTADPESFGVVFVTYNAYKELLASGRMGGEQKG